MQVVLILLVISNMDKILLLQYIVQHIACLRHFISKREWQVVEVW